MKLLLEISELLEWIPEAVTDGNCNISSIKGLASLNKAQTGDLSFLANPKYRHFVPKTNASVVILHEDYEGLPQKEQMFLRSKNPSHCLAKICRKIHQKTFAQPKPGIHPTAFVEQSALVDKSCSIGAFCYIGNDSKIGKNSVIEPNSYLGNKTKVGEDCHFFPGVKILSHSYIGDGVILNSGVVVGSEGYGFDQVKGVNKKIPHLGKVIIEDDVEIGANSCIDRARIEDTRIGAGTKIDNLVQIGHNVQIGRGCLIVAQVGIAGSVEIQDNVVVGGQAGFAGHIKVGKGAKIAAQSGITKDVDAGAYLKGNPAMPIHLFNRIAVLEKKLPDLFKRFAQGSDKK